MPLDISGWQVFSFKLEWNNPNMDFSYSKSKLENSQNMLSETLLRVVIHYLLIKPDLNIQISISIPYRSYHYYSSQFNTQSSLWSPLSSITLTSPEMYDSSGVIQPYTTTTTSTGSSDTTLPNATIGRMHIDPVSSKQFSGIFDYLVICSSEVDCSYTFQNR